MTTGAFITTGRRRYFRTKPFSTSTPERCAVNVPIDTYVAIHQIAERIGEKSVIVRGGVNYVDGVPIAKHRSIYHTSSQRGQVASASARKVRGGKRV